MAQKGDDAAAPPAVAAGQAGTEGAAPMAANATNPGLPGPTGTPAPGTPGPNGAPASTRPAPAAGLTMVVNPHQQVNMNAGETKQQAIIYLDMVRQRLQKSNPDLYHRFLDTMKDFRSQRLTPPTAVNRVRDIFKNHQDLIAGFAQFLPVNASVAYDGRDPPKRLADQLDDLVPGAAAKRLKMFPASTSEVGPAGNTTMADRLGLSFSDRLDELKFIEILKDRLPRPVYKEYLKLMTLFSHEVIDRRGFLEQSKPFFGKGPGAKELRSMLRAVLRPRYKTRDFVMDSGLPAIILSERPPAMLEKEEEEEAEDKPFAPAGKPSVDLKNAKRNGHSYRKLPASYPIAKSSGRDALCKSVLNDDWVSHPTFISEDANPQAAAIAGEASGATHSSHRNHYEEAMHKTEDERLGVDLGIDINLSLIKLLEPWERRIAAMSEQEQDDLRLPPWSLGGRSRALPNVALTRIYGETGARDVLQALAQDPATAVPVVLSRLKQKDEEWKNYKRMRNDDYWCRDDERNFSKSLDYRGITARAVDKKLISPKAFLTEVETHAEKAHYHFEFTDDGVFADVRTMLEWYLAAGVTEQTELDTVRNFVAGFVSKYFRLDGNFAPMEANEDAEDDKMALIFANENVFCFFRLFWTVYSRLQKVKDSCKEVDTAREERINATAISLGLQEVPATPSAESDSEAPKPAYEEVLSLIRRFIDQTFAENNSVRASQDFEDSCRKLLTIHGYPVYTADYLAQSLEKIILTISEDDGDSSSIFQLWEDWKKGMEVQALIIPDEPVDAVMGENGEPPAEAPEPIKWTEEGEYAERVKQMCKDENTFQIRYTPSKRALDIYILSKPQSKLSEKRSSGLNVPDEIDAHYLETIDALKVVEQFAKQGQVLLKRNLRRCLTTPQEYMRKQRLNLVVSLSPETGRMQYKRDSEDYFLRPAMPLFDNTGRPLSIWHVDKMVRKKRNARFVRWLSDVEGNAVYPEDADVSFHALLTGTGAHQTTNYVTRQELVINRAAALKYSVYRTYKMGQAPKGSARTFTIDDADQQIIKLKRKADPNAEPEDFEEDFVIDDSPHQSPNKVNPKPRPAAASGAAPKKGKQGPVKSTEPQKRGPKPLPPLRKVARAPFKGLPRLAPQPTDLRILRKYDLPTRKAPATHIIYLKPVFQQIPAAQRKKYINDLRTRQRRHRNRQFLNIMHKIDRGRWAKLGTSEWHEEWDLEQLLMGRLKYKVPGTFTARLTTRMQEAGLIITFYEVLHSSGPLKAPLKKLARRRTWTADVKDKGKVKASLGTGNFPHGPRKQEDPKRYVIKKAFKIDPAKCAFPKDSATLDYTYFPFTHPRPLRIEKRRQRNMRFIAWMEKRMKEARYPDNADDELDDFLLGRGKYGGSGKKTVPRTTSYEEAGLRLTYYHSEPAPAV